MIPGGASHGPPASTERPMRAAILCLALLLAACAASPGSGGVAPSADTNPETGAHGGGAVD